MKDRIQLAIKEARAKNPGKIVPAQDIYESIYRAGIKEVVEWVNSNWLDESNMKHWQAKLKEWRL